MRHNLATFAVLVLVTACKPSGGSDLQSIENFALGEDVRINACTAPTDELASRDPRNKMAAFIDVKDAKIAKRLSAELILAMSAVPDSAMKIFQAKNGKVFITADTPRYCSFAGAVSFKGKTPIAKSCLVTIPYGSGKTPMAKGLEGLTLVSMPDPAAIRHGVVRSMGYMVADVLKNDPNFSELRVELTKAFLTDVAKSSVFSLEAQEGLLGKGVDSLVKANLANRESNPLKGVKVSSESVYIFMDFVVGEAFDSYYCRTGKGAFFEKKTADRIKKPEDAPIFAYLTDTRKVMEYFFPRTYGTFRLVEAHMKGFADALPDVGFRGSLKTASGLGLTGESQGFSLGGGQTVGARKAQLEAAIRTHANDTRFASEQYQAKKSNYDDSWTDVWGTKKSEMDTAKAVLRYTQSKEQALLKELREVEAEEAKVGAEAKTASDREFSNVNLKVDTFDANKELAKGVQETAKGYGKAASAGAGYIGEKVGGETGRAFGEGLGDGVGGVLGAIGETATDGIKSAGETVEGARQYANDLAVDPTGTLYKTGAGALETAGKTVDNVYQTGKEIVTLDGQALATRGDALARSIPGVKTVYGTARNTYDFATATNPADAQKAIDAQYKVASAGVYDVLSEAGGNLVDEFNPLNGIKDAAKHKVTGIVAEGYNDLMLDPKLTKFGAFKEVAGAAKKVESMYEKVSEGVSTLNEAGELMEADKKAAEAAAAGNPGGAMEGLQSAVVGHANTGTAIQATPLEPMTSFDTSAMATPTPFTDNYGVPGGNIGPSQFPYDSGDQGQSQDFSAPQTATPISTPEPQPQPEPQPEPEPTFTE